MGRRIRLKVADATLRDVGEGRARVSRALLRALDLEEGDLLRLHGAHPVLASVAAGDPDDEGLDLVRLDAALRRRAGVAVGDVVEAEAHEIPVARRVRVLVVGESGADGIHADDLRPALAGQPLMVGDTVSIAPRRSEFDVHVNVLGLTVAEVFGSSTECGARLARVQHTDPAGIVRIGDATAIEIVDGTTPDVDPVRDPVPDAPGADAR